MDYQDINAATIDRWIENGWTWGKSVSHETFENAKAGNWEIQLTPVKMVPHEWIGEVSGKKVLGLASGGGQQMPILTALSAEARRCSDLRTGHGNELYHGQYGGTDRQFASV